jgi:hypothetical protein
VKNLKDNQFRLYLKGSPEKVLELSNEDTIPKNYLDVLTLYTEVNALNMYFF